MFVSKKEWDVTCVTFFETKPVYSSSVFHAEGCLTFEWGGGGVNDTWQRQVAHKRSEQTEDAPRIRLPNMRYCDSFEDYSQLALKGWQSNRYTLIFPMSINHATENGIELRMLFFICSFIHWWFHQWNPIPSVINLTSLPSIFPTFLISVKIFQIIFLLKINKLPRNNVPPLRNKSYFSQSSFERKEKEQISRSPFIRSTRITFLFGSWKLCLVNDCDAKFQGQSVERERERGSP